MKMILCKIFFPLILIYSVNFLYADFGIDSYFQLVNKYPSSFVSPTGDSTKGEIQIILDKNKMQEIELSTGRRVGVVAQDRFWIWVNDACRFPNGKYGVYGRMMWVKSLEGPSGVIVMPILPDGRIVLNYNFRHATRSWEIELPRGCVNKNEEIDDAARREVVEETGMMVGQLLKLGEMAVDTGMSNTIAIVYAAKVEEQLESHPEDSEAIAEIFSLSLSEIKQAFKLGYYEGPLGGEMVKVPFRDPFLAYAILLYEIHFHL